MSIEGPRKETFESMKREADEQIKELEEKYPTVESIVDDYRMTFIDRSTVAFRFPDSKDQEEVFRLAVERNKAEGLPY
jgi:hypothetical protein